jgi:hypothetical protein
VHDVAILLVALAVCYLPGVALLSAFAVRRPLLLVALAPGLSVALCGVVAVLSALVGLRYGPATVGVVVAVLAVVAVLRAVRTERGRSARRVSLTGSVPTALGVAMTVIGAGFGGWSWLVGLGGLDTVPQEHDMIIHAMQTAYIMRTGHAAPWELVPADVLSGGPVSFYPSGFHLLAGLTAGLIGGDVVAALNAMTVVVLVLVLCTGVAALGAVAARRVGLSRGSAALAGGIASLVVAGMYRPGFHLMHDGGILGNAAAFALVPGVVAAVVSLPGRGVVAGALAGAAAAGAVWIHPSVAVSISLTVLAWWIGEAVSPAGRRRLRGLLKPLAGAVVAGGTLLAPAVGPGLGAAGRTGAFPPDTGPVPFRDAIGNTFSMPYSGWIDQAFSRSQVAAVVLLFVGVAVLVALRRGLGPVAAWGFWSLVTIGAWLTPGRGPDSVITGFFYNAMLRTWSHISLLAPVIAGLGVVLVANRIAVLVRGRRIPLRATWTSAVLSSAVFALYAAGPASGYADVGENAVATRYSTPDFVRVGPDDQAAIAWLADRIRPGERVFNSPNDGSTYLYVERGVPVVNVYTLGLPGVPYTYQLLEDFNRYPTDPAVLRELADLDVHWVYVDSSAPGIGSNGSPENWAGSDGFSLAPGLADLDGLPGLSLAFRSGTVSVYSLDLGVATPTAP